jgi:cysteine-S-conjugate beta-lyase
MASKKDIAGFGKSTQLTMLGRAPDEQYGFVNAPLYRGSTVIYKSVDDIENHNQRFYYGTAGSPTIAHLEEAWTQLTGAAGTVLSPSGLGSVALALMALTKSGDHILIPDCAYGPTRRLCNGLLARYGVETTYYDPMIADDIEQLFKHNTTVLFIEAPGSQTMEIADVPAMVRVAKKHNVRTVMDNTWATPLFFRCHDFGIDVTVEAGTKYLSGHSDLLLGLATANADCWPALRETYDAMAMLPGPEDCILALRGMRTMHLRLKEAERRALELADWLKGRPEVMKVLHPAFEDCPGHANWARDFEGSSGLFSIMLHDHYTRAGLSDMLDNMKIFGMGFSWGGYESLVTPVNPVKNRTAKPWSHPGFALRLQVGLEDMEDIKSDLENGFARLNMHRK